MNCMDKEIIDKVKYWIQTTLVILLVVVFIYEIKALRTPIKYIFAFIELHKMLWGLSVENVKSLYFLLREIAIYLLIIGLLILLLMKGYLIIRSIFNNPDSSKMNAFENSMYKYINSKHIDKGYLVAGEWGSGKTYMVNMFFENYYKYSSLKVYRISCFGLESREQVMKEIRNQIELNDESILNWIRYIPIVGQPIYALLKKSYGLHSIPKGSVLIFDDFERITSLGIGQRDTSNYYSKNPFLNRTNAGQPQIKEFNDINKEFENIDKAFKRIQRTENQANINNNLQKYNIVTGLINEIVEKYKMKAIIICNVDILGYDYVDKVFRDKLDCITYNKASSTTSLKGIVDTVLKSQIFSNEILRETLNSFMNQIIEDFENVWQASDTKNLRQVKSIFQAFVETAIILPDDKVKNDYLLSLFYNIYTVRMLQNERNIAHLNNFQIGSSLLFYLKLYGKENFINNLTLSKYAEEIKWVGIEVAGFWSLNLSRPENLNKMVEDYYDYMYFDLELKLTANQEIDIENGRFSLQHVLFAILNECRLASTQQNSTIDNRTSEYIRLHLVSLWHDNDNIQNQVQHLLDKLGEILHGGLYLPVINKWFESIYLSSHISQLSEDTQQYTINQYNQFVKEYKKIHTSEENLSRVD